MSNPVSDKSEARESLKARLAAAKAARQVLEIPTEEEEDAALVAELEREERALTEAKARKEAKRALGNKFAELNTPMGLVILKRSGTGTFRALQELESIDLDQMEQFVSPCVFYPERDKFERIVEELPGAIPAMFKAISILMGAVQAETSKK